ncbi:MAG: HAD family hydrolase [Clostridia bacterium]|nr:HAD family hydrolase [Clostridia bacterium]
MPFPDAAPILSKCKRHRFRLGIIANQNPCTKRRLERRNLISCFDVIAASAELGVAKSNPSIFQWALQQADTLPQNSAMVGDRLDKDIAPSNRLGMHSIRLLRGLSAYHEPQCSDENPEYPIQSLKDLINLL